MMASSVTRTLAIGERMHQLKLFFSNRFVYAHVIRKTDGHILASASTNEKEVRESLPNRSDKNAAALVGRTIAARAKSADIPAVHFVKPKGKRFHGKMKALIDNMREAGLPLNHSTLAAAAASTSAPAPAAR